MPKMLSLFATVLAVKALGITTPRDVLLSANSVIQ
jgi:hypothetical protein